MIHIVSIRTGLKYSPEYSAILHDMASRNCSTVDVAHWEITDDPDSVPSGVNVIPANPDLPGWWQKPYLFSRDMPWAEGDRVLYLDLDVAITGRLEDFAKTKGIIKDWSWPTFNSSVMCWDVGEHRQIWDAFDPAIIDQPARLLEADALPGAQINGGDQEWITEAAPDFPVLPASWCVSYKLHAVSWPPTEAKVVVFHGRPNPSDITEGWVPNVWKTGGYTSLPEMNGVNVESHTITDNIKANVLRDVPWFSGFGPQAKSAIICCGGPSLLDSLPDIRHHARNGSRIVTVNNAWRVLVENGIHPDACILLDARPENAEFIKGGEHLKWFVASQCDASIFEGLKDHNLVMWHSHIGDEIEVIVKPYMETHPVCLVPGGGTVGLRAINLCWLSGYSRIHVYGLDGSYEGDRHHAYSQTLNDDEHILTVMHGGKSYRCATWMARQAEEFQDQWRFLTARGIKIFVHGRGLIPDIAKQLKAEARAA